MALELGKRRRGRLSMTSLIDVIFLLLLFFMLSSTFSKFGEIELSSGGPGGASGDRPVLFLRLGNSRVLLNGRAVAPDQVPDALREMIGDEKRLLLISLTEGVTAQGLVDLLAQLRGIEGLHINVMS